MTLTEIKSILTERGFSPLKQLGQNFLHDQNLTAWLAERCLGDLVTGSLDREFTLVEIGPGLGALTEPLLKRLADFPHAKLIALEKDRGLSAFLRERFAPQIAAGRFELREGDALHFVPALTEKPEVICGNLPYYISTPLLMESLQKVGLNGQPSRLFFVVQREVGQRLASRADGEHYGGLSVLVQVSHQVELVRTLPGSVFFPAPDVASVALQLTPLAQPLITPTERAAFTKIVQRGFSQRRKKLSNLLPTSDGRRAEHLSPADWVALWKEVQKVEAKKNEEAPC